jgi:general nucleoside transport system permease protein
MASTITSPPAARATDTQPLLKLTRMTIFALVFLVAGALLLLGNAQYANTNTTLTFDAANTSAITPLVVPVQPYSVFVGLLYVFGGALTLLPAPSLDLTKKVWLALNGVLIIPTLLIIAAAGNSTNVTVMLQVSLRLATPIALGALAGIWCEKSGVVNVAIEGMMLTGACFGFASSTLLTPSMGAQTALLVGLVVAVISGGLMAMLHAWLSITFKTDQVVSGTVINILAVGLTSFTRREILFSSQAGRETLPVIPIAPLDRIPILGPVFFSGKPIFYAMFILLFLTAIIFYYTRWGLRTRAVGENPHAADTLGINVIRMRWTNVIIAGLIAGLAGAWFSIETTGTFDDNMTSGRGFIALAAMIFGKWNPFGAFAGALLFGFSDALGQRFQFLGVDIPPQFLQMVPYIITIIVLAGLVGRAIAPKADGVPYEKEGK